MIDRRDSILLAAMSVFSKYGYHNSKMAKIAEVADVGAGTIYLSFKNKEDILEEIFYRFWARALEEFNKINAEQIGAKEKIVEITNSLINLVLEEDDFSKIILHEFRFWNSGEQRKITEVVNEAKNVLTRIIKDGMQSGELKSVFSPEISLAFFTGGLWHLLASWSANKENFDINAIREKTVQLVLLGLTGE